MEEELCLWSLPTLLFSPFSISISISISSVPISLLLSTMEETKTYKTSLELKGVVTSVVVNTEEEEEEEEELGLDEDDKKRKTLITKSGILCCQAEKCTADLSVAKRYHRRHKVCESHSKSPVVIVAGLRQRFCQQCSRFHELSEFDETKRSCRSRLAGHNERRRKSSSDSHGEGSSSKGVNPELKENHCRQANQSGTRITFTAGNTKHFQIS